MLAPRCVTSFNNVPRYVKRNKHYYYYYRNHFFSLTDFCILGPMVFFYISGPLVFYLFSSLDSVTQLVTFVLVFFLGRYEKLPRPP